MRKSFFWIAAALLAVAGCGRKASISPSEAFLQLAADSIRVDSSWAFGQTMVWRRVSMDGSRTGVQASSADDVDEMLGEMEDGMYVSPKGEEYDSTTATAKVASLLLAAQDSMEDVKEVIGTCPEGMVRSYPECALGDWFVDHMMAEAEKLSGKKVSFGILNFGGIREDMPKGDILRDDILSMFPFKNNLCYLELHGRDIRAILEHLAATGWQVVGGARCVVRDGKLVSAEIDGAPIDDEKIYGVMTISFLLDGGDGIFVARNAVSLQMFPEYVADVMLPYVESLTREGKPVEYSTDGRIVIEDDKEEEK
jgi:2',3'-cyclic-nucleotide 2'-phosphodiesterase (5'-nucleotidase family)